MGTSASIQIEDEEGEPLVGIHIHWDGDRIPTFVKKFSDGKPVVNGYNGEDMFNGMGDYAARLIANLKFKRYDGFEDYTKPGDIYVVPYAEAYGEYEVLVKYGGPNNPVIVQRQVDGEPFGKININKKKTNMKGAETFNADYSLYDRKAKQKVGVKSGYDDYKDAYDDWENEIIKEYPNRVSENEWIVIDTHSAETFNAEEDEWVGGDNGEQIYWSHPSGYQVIQNKIGGLIFIVNEKGGYQGGDYSNIDDAIRNAERMISMGAETFNAYKVAPALSSYSKDELISSKAGPQGSASYDEMVYDPIAQDRLSAEECSKCVVDRELSGLGKGSSIGFHTSSRSACPSWCINAQDRLSAESFASDEERRLKAFAKKIENEKKKLVKKAKRSGFYENFGQKEVRKLEDSISDLDYYEQQKYQEMIRDFDNWADSIDLRGLERYAESFASETSSTLKSMGYVAGTIGVGYLIFQRFVKDKLDETMNQ